MFDGGGQVRAVDSINENRMTLTQRLSEEKKRLETRLGDVKIALTALEKNPEIQKVLDIVSRI